MRKTTLRTVSVKIKGKRLWQVVVPRLGGGRTRKTFKLREDAKRYFDLARIQVENYGTAAMGISDALRNEAIKCQELLASFGKSITDATQFYVGHLKTISASQSVKSVIASLRAGREADRRSVRYLRDLKYRLTRFERDFGEKQIAEITTVEVENWLQTLNLGPVSRNTFRRRLVTLFEFAKNRGWCPSNPALPTATVQEISDDVGILSPSEVAGLLAAASIETLPYWAIGAFAGLRASEIERLDWANVNFEERLIDVKASKSKTASRRQVRIEDNLFEWLLPYRSKTGRVVPDSLRKRLLSDRARAAEAGTLTRKWPSNALRHSFASYHLAHFRHPGELAVELGHTSQNLIYRHYRSLVKPSEAATYWNIKPLVTNKVLPLQNVAA